MLTSLSSNAITAKARAIYGKRLTTAQYHDLLRQRTVSDVAAYLKMNTGYSNCLSGISEIQIHRGQLEVLLQRSRLDQFIKLCHYDFSKSRGFYHYAVADVEVNVLMRTLMLLNSGSPQDIITALPAFLQEYICFDFMKLSKITGEEELLEVLFATPYYSILKRCRDSSGKLGLAECEHELKTYYYSTILKLIDANYRGKLRKNLRGIVLIEIEILNLSLIYRLKNYFKRTPEQIKRQLLPFYYKVTPRILDALLEPQPDEEFIRKIKLTAYNSKMKNVQYNYIEDYTKRLKYLVSKKLMQFTEDAPIAFYSLMTMLQIEIENLTIIIEGIRYGEAPSDIEKLLILE